MYCIVSEASLRDSIYGRRGGGFWRGSIINIKASHDQQIPHIVAAIPSILLGATSTERLTSYIQRTNTVRNRSFMLCKAMGTPNGVAFQIMSRGGSQLIRPDGEYPQRRMVLIHPEKINHDDYRNFNAQTKQILSMRDAKRNRHFDALSMYWTDPNHLFDANRLRKFEEFAGEYATNSGTDLYLIMRGLEDTYHYRSES